ncbi:MAG: adenylate kinase [Actinomycetota bacterium]|nr:adenylate kinase [Actinomycetota bacterium]
MTPPDLNLVLLGPPGAGKGTQAKPLAAELDLVYVATGDLLRTAVAAGAPVGRDAKRYMDAGELVPDELIIGLLKEALERDAPAGGFVLDGFPRTIDQAQALDAALERLGQPAPRAILIDVRDEVLIARLSGRRICADHGHEYHLQFRPPARQGSCDVDGSPLIRRTDDEPATIRRRLAVYHSQTNPLITHFEVRGRLLRIDGDGEPAEIRRRLAAAVSWPTVT